MIGGANKISTPAWLAALLHLDPDSDPILTAMDHKTYVSCE